jgi:hypothetical protein
VEDGAGHSRLVYMTNRILVLSGVLSLAAFAAAGIAAAGKATQ